MLEGNKTKQEGLDAFTSKHAEPRRRRMNGNLSPSNQRVAFQRRLTGGILVHIGTARTGAFVIWDGMGT